MLLMLLCVAAGNISAQGIIRAVGMDCADNYNEFQIDEPGCTAMQWYVSSTPSRTIDYAGPNYIEVRWHEMGTATVGADCNCNGQIRWLSYDAPINISGLATPGVSITASTTSVCQSSAANVTFTAWPENGGDWPTYYWRVNGATVSSGTSNTFNRPMSAINNGDVIDVVMYSSACAAPVDATSNSIAMTLTDMFPLSVSINGPGPLCAGSLWSTAVETTISDEDGIRFTWYRGQEVLKEAVGYSAGGGFGSTSLRVGDKIRCKATYIGSNCVSGSPAWSNELTVQPFIQLQPPSMTLDIPSGNTSYCQGDNITFEASGGYLSNFQWRLNNESVGTNSPYFTTNQFTQGSVLTVTASQQGGDCRTGGTASASTAGLGITINSYPNSTTAPDGDVVICSTCNKTLQASPTGSGYSYQWLKDGVPVPGATESSYNTNVPGQYKVTVTKNGCGKPSDNATRIILNNPPVAYAGANQAIVLPANAVVLAGSGSDPDGSALTYAWTKTSGPNASLSGTKTATLLAEELSVGAYTFRLTASDGIEQKSADVNITVDFPPYNYNYFRETTVMVASQKTTNNVASLPVGTGKKAETTTYSDGLGRTMQIITTQGSPAQHDIVQPFAYDDFGREAVKYLPYTDGNNGLYKENALEMPNHNPPLLTKQDKYQSGQQYAFYQSGGNLAKDSYPYQQTIFEPSPLNRVLKEGSPGQVWQPNSVQAYNAEDRTVKLAFEKNTTGEVLMWTYEYPTAGLPFGAVDAGGGSVFYAPSELHKTKTKDEQDHEVIEYKDSEGKVVLRKVQAGATAWAQTNYIYDDLGNLVCVIPPEASQRLATEYFNQASAAKEEFLKRWAFRYDYDERNRATQKQVPGAAPIYMVYDDRDRLVLTQDGNQRVAYKWSFTKYDALNRPIITGIYTHTGVADQAAMSTQVSTTNFFETYNASQPHLYTNNVFPQLGTSTEVFTVNYYDNYNFAATWGADFSYKPAQVASQIVNGVTYSQPASANTIVVGQVTGTKIKNLGDGSWLNTVTYYDDKYRAIQTTAGHQRKGLDRATNLYDFAGKVLATKTEHTEAGIVWKDMVNVTQSGNELKKAAMPYGANAGAASVQVLPAGQDGWVEMVYPGSGGTGSEQFFGLNDTNPDVQGTDINYAFFITANSAAGNVRVYENGVLRGGLGLMKVKGDVLRIERVGTQVTYKVNGFVEYTSPVPSTTALMADVTILQSSGFTYGTRASFTQRSTSVTRRFDYDHAGRLASTGHSVNGQPEVLLAKNEYNAVGQLVTKNLHGTGNNTFKQYTDYRYNIRGWLTNINDPATPQAGDLFNMSLRYNDPTTKGGTAQYNGNISETIWSSAGLDKQSYGYSYDVLNRLTEAKYYNALVSAEDGRYNEKIGDAGLNRPGYDLNGNILNLFRHGKKTATGFGLMDDLGYTYAGGGNQLTAVSDGITTQVAENGFKEAVEGSLDYTYDANGNMMKDVNKGVTSIEYNHLNLPSKVSKGTSEYITYAYDATGRKLTQQVFGTKPKRTDYAGEMVYENDTLRFINHEEGRVVMTGTTPEYQYHLKDHLGNVRVTFTTKDEVEIFTATLEPGSQGAESANFKNYNPTERDLFDHTDEGTTYKYAQLLHGGNNSQIGLAKSLSVMPGDTIRAAVHAKYQLLQNPGSGLSGFAIALTSAFGLSTPSPGDPSTAAYDALDTYGTLIEGGFDHSDDEAAPKAYLNILLFDRDHNLVDAAYRQIDGDYSQGVDPLVKDPHDSLGIEKLVTIPGYAYIFVSNENPVQVDVFFDDLKIEHVKSPVVATDDYYPFGLTFNSYQRENSLANQYLFAGKERQDELEIGWLDFGARMYQSEIARWNGIDASSENYVNQSPYHYAGNNPIKFVDFDGNDYGVTVDRGNKTIKIEAHFLTSSKSSTAFAEHGSGKWNAQSGKNVFVAGGLKALRQGKADVYKIEISVTSEVSGGADGQGRYQSDRDQKVNQDQTGTLNSFDVETTGFVANQGGGTGSDQVDMKKGEENSSITTHEVNHAMGIAHTGDGGNQSPSGGGFVGTGEIGETLKGVGIGGDNSQRNKTKTSGVGDGTLLGNSSNQGLGQGSVISQARYDRIVKRIERREERRNQN